ncbi:monovalent cation/H+ antiporter complex subunit F [Chloroflexota bacterium]
MMEVVTDVALVVLAISILLCLYRVVIGPSVPDRVIALDTAAVCGVAIAVVIAIKYGAGMYLDVALIVAVLSFVGTVAIAKFLIRGKIID